MDTRGNTLRHNRLATITYMYMYLHVLIIIILTGSTFGEHQNVALKRSILPSSSTRDNMILFAGNIFDVPLKASQYYTYNAHDRGR